MKTSPPTVTGIRPSRPSLHSRVLRKREVLQQWLDDGVPYDKLDSVPTSLNEARLWDDQALNIFAIGSPNNFTSKHPIVGDDVQVIANLLRKLQEKLRRPKPQRRSRDDRPTISPTEIDEVLSSLVSQWHLAREEARVQRARADLAEAMRDIATQELRVKDAEIADLKRRLVSKLKVVQ